MIDAALLVAVVAVPLAAAALSWVVRSDRWRCALVLPVVLVLLGLTLTLVARVLHLGTVAAFANWLYLDHVGAVVLLVVTLVSAVAGPYSVVYFRSRARAQLTHTDELRTYLALFFLLVATMTAAAIAGNLGLLWTAVTATTFASAPLVDFYGSHEPLEAAWKYVILAVAGDLIALFGFLCLYAAGIGWLGGHYDFSVPVLEAAGPHLEPVLGTLGFLLVLVGFGTKAGLAPMHTWLPDAYQQAPVPVGAMLAGAEINCAMLAIMRVLALVTPAEHGGLALREALLAFGLFSMTVGVVFLIAQRDFKRLLAYSSVEQMGLLATGLALGSPIAVAGAFLQMVAQSLAKACMFFNAGTLLLRFRTTTVAEVPAVIRTAPVTAALVLGAALATAGAPPFGLFLAEISIVSGGLATRAWAAAGFAAALLVVGFIALVAPYSRMVFGDGAPAPAPGPRRTLGPAILVPGAVLLAGLLVLGVFVPQPLHALLAGAAREIRQ